MIAVSATLALSTPAAGADVRENLVAQPEGAPSADPSPNAPPESALIDPVDAAAMAAQTPLSDFAARVRALAVGPDGTAFATHSGFMAIGLVGETVVVYWAGPVPSDVTALIAEAPVPAVIRTAPYSLAHVTAAAGQVTAALVEWGGSFAVTYPTSGTRLTIEVEPVTLTSASVSTTALTVDMPAVTEAPVEVEPLTRDLIPDVGMPVVIVEDDLPVPSVGPHDADGNLSGDGVIRAGAVIQNPQTTCSAGFGINWQAPGDVNTREWLLTAAHCGYPAQTWYDGRGNTYAGTFRHEHVSDDLALLGGANYSYKLWWHSGTQRPSTGFPWSIGEAGSATTTNVTRWENPLPGQLICVNGPRTGIRCDIQVQNSWTYEIRFTDSDDRTRTVTGLMMGRSRMGQRVAQDGDSGGPVFRVITNSGIPNTLSAYGIISAANRDGNEVFFQDSGTIFHMYPRATLISGN